MENKQKTKNVSNWMISVISFISVFILLLIFMLLNGIAPFGNKTFTGMDANIQYADLFSYYQNVLMGKDSFMFSLSNLLGDSGISIFGYYLASPLNLLVLLFNKQSIGTSYFDLLFALKISLAAAFFSIFCSSWLKDKDNKYFNFIFSICFAFMQYNASQASNIIWLDGVYMLPLILLGTHKGVSQNKWLLFSITIACSIIFNWYTGLINCLFSLIWVLFEVFYTRRKFLPSFINYVIAAIGGALISGIIFYPVYKSMQASSRNGLDWNQFGIGLNGNPVNSISNYAIGAVSSQGKVSLYCGMLVLVFIIAFFLSKQILTRTKVIFGCLIFITLMLFYFEPFVFAFSIFKEVNSYWYRYSYLGCFVLLFIAQYYVSNVQINNNEKQKLIISMTSIVLLDILLFSVKGNIEYRFSALFVVLYLIIFLIFFGWKSRRLLRGLGIVVLSILVFSELLINLKKEYEVYLPTTINAKNYALYVKNQNNQINNIKRKDSSLYRISQTKTRLQADDETLTANYNEGLAYGFYSIAGYTSSPSSSQLIALNKFGYRTEQQRMSIVNTSILPVDSILGVKYILSPYKTNGLNEIAKKASFTNKKVLKNPYAFPIAFTGSAVEKVGSYRNTFTYQNRVISNLVGKELKIYAPVKWTKSDSKIYTLMIDNSNPVYGNLPWNPQNMRPTTVFANGKKVTAYSQWLSPSVFNIPNEGKRQIKVKVQGEGYSTTSEFYQVNLQQLKIASDIAKNRAVKITRQNNRSYQLFLNKNNEKFLYLSIPNSSNWQVLNNGKISKHTGVYDAFMQIPLKKGVNKITLSYKNPGIFTGLVMFLVGCIIVVLQRYNLSK